jgi:hypothetical protein
MRGRSVVERTISIPGPGPLHRPAQPKDIMTFVNSCKQ